MKIIKHPAADTWEVLASRPLMVDHHLEVTVANIINLVKELGDLALKSLTEKYDQVPLQKIVHKIPKSVTGVSADLRRAIQTAYDNITKFHSSQLESFPTIETMPGVSCWRKSLPIEKVGLYIPGGTAPLFSSLLMLAVPARLARCKELVVCTPPREDGKVHPSMIYTAQLLGIDKIYTIGGAQAIAAMAYGTESVPKVYKIFGPGNQFVTAAKQQVCADGLAIDFPAGPSEVAILADSEAQPQFVAADLLSQAEHGTDSQVILATDSEQLLQEVLEKLDQQVSTLPRKEIAQEALKHSKMLLFSDLGEAMKFLNTYAPEHLIINTAEPQIWAEQVVNAGSVFLGAYTPESVGDYASGTNHTLPTNGYSRMYAGVSLDSFIKKVTFQQLTEEGLENLGPHVEIMAEIEGLQAHKQAVSIRRRFIHNERGNTTIGSTKY